MTIASAGKLAEYVKLFLKMVTAWSISKQRLLYSDWPTKELTRGPIAGCGHEVKIEGVRVDGECDGKIFALHGC